MKPVAPAIHHLAEAILTLRQFGFVVDAVNLNNVADASEEIAELEVAYAVHQANRIAAVETMLMGTVVYGRVFAEIRRLALEAVSARLDKPTKSRRRAEG